MQIDLSQPLYKELPTIESWMALPKPLVNNDGIVAWWHDYEFDGVTYTLRKMCYTVSFRRLILGCREYDDLRWYGDKRIRQCVGSHMKFYIDVNDKSALITSANLVAPTLAEIGVIISDKKQIKALRRYFNKLWNQLK